jgi:hypothetical protein
MAKDLEEFFGGLVGGLVALVVAFGVWGGLIAAAFQSPYWWMPLVAMFLGVIPAVVLAQFAAIVARHLWPLVVLLVGGAIYVWLRPF